MSVFLADIIGALKSGLSISESSVFIMNMHKSRSTDCSMCAQGMCSTELSSCTCACGKGSST